MYVWPEWLGSGLQIRIMQVRILSRTPKLVRKYTLYFYNRLVDKVCGTSYTLSIDWEINHCSLKLICSVRLSVRTLPFHGSKEGFDSPTEYHIKIYWVTNSSRWLRSTWWPHHLAKFTWNLPMALETKLACNVEIVLSADEAVRSQMKFWNDNHTLMYFNMVSL